MSLTIYITKDFDQMSHVAAQITEAKIKHIQASAQTVNLGLATGNSPTGLYKHLAKAFNSKRLDADRVRSFNLDEYIGLPGENAQQRALHCKSYSYFMIAELFGLLQQKFIETYVPYGSLIEQTQLEKELTAHPEYYTMRGNSRGQAIEINAEAAGLLREIKQNILDSYLRKIEEAGGIDLQIIGVGGLGHVAFHESGIPFDCSPIILVKLDDNTIKNAVTDGSFASVAESPHYAISMSTELVFKAKTVLLLANGPRKTTPIAKSLLDSISCDVPLSYSQQYAATGGEMIYILDEPAALDVLTARDILLSKGYTVVDLRHESYEKVEQIMFSRNPQTCILG
ncbi:MAG: 6-phosphogluconolactonase [Desulfobulbus sp.]|nr:6-phosphogluconolactonase [Desulfobulbus sp.]